MCRGIARLVVAVALGAPLLPAAAPAQPPAKVPRVGVLASSAAANSPYVFEAFRQGLRELGYVEGRNIAIEWRFAEGKLDRLPDLAAELVRLKVDVIVASSNPGIVALKRATETIPIVMSVVGDPVGSGFVASLARPGGNITGLSNMAEDLSGKRLELLREVVPRLSRVAVWRNPTIPTHVTLWRETQDAATAMRLKMLSVDIRGPDELEGMFGAMTRERADAFIVLPEPVTLVHRARVASLAAKHGPPGMYPFGEFVASGGLMAYSPNLADLWRRSAYFVDRILKGARPADLPVEQPTRFELVINMKTAKALGLTIPQSVLIRADQVIQ